MILANQQTNNNNFANTHQIKNPVNHFHINQQECNILQKQLTITNHQIFQFQSSELKSQESGFKYHNDERQTCEKILNFKKTKAVVKVLRKPTVLRRIIQLNSALKMSILHSSKSAQSATSSNYQEDCSTPVLSTENNWKYELSKKGTVNKKQYDKTVKNEDISISKILSNTPILSTKIRPIKKTVFKIIRKERVHNKSQSAKQMNITPSLNKISCLKNSPTKMYQNLNILLKTDQLQFEMVHAQKQESKQLTNKNGFTMYQDNQRVGGPIELKHMLQHHRQDNDVQSDQEQMDQAKAYLYSSLIQRCFSSC